MMMPSLTPSSSSSFAPSSSATVRVEKATSEFLIGPDWTLNMDICDTINYNQPLAKDVVKAVKKRLQHKNPKVHLLALTLLETMVKNCGDYVHFQIAEKNILQEMIKIVKKKADMHVRDKILTLLDSWQEAFGGPGGKYPQYYLAYDELRRYGVAFPLRLHDEAPIFTPPVTHPTPIQPQPGNGMPNNSSVSLDEAMATETENLSLSNIDSMRDVADLLADMLQAVNPSDCLAVKDEVIVDLVEQCRTNQKKLMQCLVTTGDEELLADGLELNDSLQSLLAKHNAIASGSPLLVPVPHVTPQSSGKHSTCPKPDEARKPSSAPTPGPSAPVRAEIRGNVDEDENEDKEDDFAQLARRHSRAHSSGTQSTSVEVSGGGASVNAKSSSIPAVSSTTMTSNALVLADPPAPARKTKVQDFVELLSLSLSTDTSSPGAPQASVPSTHSMNHMPAGVGNPYNSQAYLGNQGQVFNSYIAPWAQPQAQHQFQPQAQPPAQPRDQSQPQAHHQLHPQAPPLGQSQDQFQPKGQPQRQPQHQFRPEAQLQPQPRYQFQPEARSHPLYQPQPQPQQLVPSATQPQPQHEQHHLQDKPSYPPPPWAPTPGYFSNTNTSNKAYAHSTPQTIATSPMPPQAARSVQHLNSFPLRGSSGSVINGDVQSTSSPRNSTSTTGHNRFVPSYRLFEDLNVLGNIDGRPKVTDTSSPSLSEARSQNISAQRK